MVKGGTITLAKKILHIFRYCFFIWSDINKKYHKKIIEYCNNCVNDKIGIIYREIMINNKDILVFFNKTIHGI